MNNESEIVALLPLKANSTRVKGKNFRDFNGKPLFRWVLNTLLSLREISKVVINTDARHILEKNGLKASQRVIIRDRKPELCGDDVSMNLILADDVTSVPASFYVMTHITNPLLSADTVKAAIDKFTDPKNSHMFDSLFTVNRFQARFYRADGSPVNHDPGNLIPTQELEPWYEENSNLYIFTGESFAKTKARIGERPMMMETPRNESIDIDEVEDWKVALALAKTFPD